MATKNPRVMMVLDPPLYRWVKKLAKSEGLSLSTKLRDLIRETFENHEDRYWAREGEKRLKGLKRSHALPHDEFWKKAGL